MWHPDGEAVEGVYWRRGNRGEPLNQEVGPEACALEGKPRRRPRYGSGREGAAGLWVSAFAAAGKAVCAASRNIAVSFSVLFAWKRKKKWEIRDTKTGVSVSLGASASPYILYGRRYSKDCVSCQGADRILMTQ